MQNATTGITGFEPVAFDVTGRHSNQTELYPQPNIFVRQKKIIMDSEQNDGKGN